MVAYFGAEGIVGYISILHVLKGKTALDQGGPVEVVDDRGLAGEAVGWAATASDEPVMFCNACQRSAPDTQPTLYSLRSGNNQKKKELTLVFPILLWCNL